MNMFTVRAIDNTDPYFISEMTPLFPVYNN